MIAPQDQHRSPQHATSSGVSSGMSSSPSSAMSTPPGGDPFDPYGPGGPLAAPGAPSTATSVLEREETAAEQQLSEPGDHERFSHYVRKEKILESAVSGAPVVALCGKVWVPGRDPNRFPVCPVCKEIFEGLREPADGED